jgi:hypothetical protein
VALIDEADLRTTERQLRLDGSWFHKGRIESGAGESIGEALLKPRNDLCASVERDRATEPLGDWTKLVETVAMVSMIMGDDQMVNFTDFCCEELLPQIGAAIDQQPFAAAFNKDGGPKPAVSRLRGIAFAPIRPDPGNAERSSAPQNTDFQ